VTSKRRKSPRQTPRAPRARKIESTLPSSRYIFFGGKGGVGKTTAASATALLLLKHAESEETILLFSTDPAHSLSDSLNKRIGNRLVEVARKGNAKLFAFEMDAGVALEDFRTRHRKVLAEIAERGTLLDESDINELLSLSLPGLDEVMALFELSELDRASVYSHIVIDTAPSGHTSRLLRLPEVFSRMVTALDRMADKHRYIVAHFARRRVVADEVDLFLSDLNKRIERVRSLLYDSEQTMFALVSIPEAMSLRETERYLDSLRSEGVPVTDLIINRVEREHGDCDSCRARVVSQRPWLNELERKFSDLKQHRVALLAGEVRGLETLELIGQEIWFEKSAPKISRSKISKRSKSEATSDAKFALGKHRISIFGGKGGVGKTTASAAYALTLAKENPKLKVLLFSTDPAHSLSDSLDENIGPMRKRVAGLSNLDAMEIDPGKWFEDLKRRYRSWTDDLFDSLAAGSKLEIKFDREAMRELVELTPPGIDEIAALGSISDLLDQNQYQAIVIDTAPTGHVIRFLELPQVALSWVRTFIKLLLKYQHIVHATRIAEELVTLSKNIKRVLALLTDRKLSEFVGVAIPEQMSLEETVDLASALTHLEVPMQRLLINGVIRDEVAAQCRFCNLRHEAQQSVIKEFRKRLDESVEIFVATQRNSDIRGVNLLLKHFDSWKENRPKKLRRELVAVKNTGKPKPKRTPKRTNDRKRTEKLAAK
jgi:arsenite/tail-anchored protein-transporting ATPase